MKNSSSRNKLTLSILVCLVTGMLGVSFCASKSEHTISYLANKQQVFADSAQSALVLPLRQIVSEYIDNTTNKPAVEFSDSFFLEVANGLLTYEISRVFKVNPLQDDSSGTAQTLGKKWSIVAGDTGSPRQVADFVRQVANRCSVELVVLPYSCHIKHSTLQHQGWRNSKYESPNYERPVSYTAQALFHLQIWSRDGRLLYERLGRGSTGRPVLYSLLRKDDPGENVVGYARRFFAPPLVKALNEAIGDAARIR